MKYIVGVVKTSSYEYHVSTTLGKKEAKKLANKLHCDPKTEDSPIVDYDYYVEEDDSDING